MVCRAAFTVLRWRTPAMEVPVDLAEGRCRGARYVLRKTVFVDTAGCCRLIEVFQLRDVYGFAPDIPGPAATLRYVGRVPRSGPGMRQPAASAEESMTDMKYPRGWDEERVKRVLAHYEQRADDEAVAEDEAAYESTTHTAMEVPVELEVVAPWTLQYNPAGFQ